MILSQGTSIRYPPVYGPQIIAWVSSDTRLNHWITEVTISEERPHAFERSKLVLTKGDFITPLYGFLVRHENYANGKEVIAWFKHESRAINFLETAIGVSLNVEGSILVDLAKQDQEATK